MLDRTSDRRRLRASFLALGLFCLAGCSSSSNFNVMLFADPGKYEYFTCDQILTVGRNTSVREAKLRDLIERAERSPGGALVGTMAYRGELRAVSEEMAVIETTARRKNCLTPDTWRSTTAIQ